MQARIKVARSLPYDVDRVWRAVVDPSSDKYNSMWDINHEDLGNDQAVRQGSRVLITPSQTAMMRAPRLLKGIVSPVLPFVFQVEQLDPESMHRQDVATNPIAQAYIDRDVCENEGGSLVTMSADISAGIPDLFMRGVMRGRSIEDVMGNHLTLALGRLADIADLYGSSTE